METDPSRSLELRNGALLDTANLQLRSYQYEMLQKSKQGNTILAMDTGSGKTFIAVSRISAELETCPPDKFAWFLVPSVALAQQQHKVLSQHLPGFQIRLLTGNDGVECWGRKSVWDDVLLNVRIVVSTHQVLLDALVHGFMQMTRLAILVFDEAHHCTGNHPANKILQGFYHPCRNHCPAKVPAILGLTASPVVNKRYRGLETIEQSLNAVSCTPKLHREDMLQFVPRPNIRSLVYPPHSYVQVPQSLELLQNLYTNLDITQDPYVIKLQNIPNQIASSQLREVLISHQTYCRDQIKRLLNRAFTIQDELGPWATNCFIDNCIERFGVAANEGSIDPNNLDDDEIFYLRRQLGTILRSTEHEINDDDEISPKAKILIDFLQEQASTNFSGLIFVETRATVALLAHLLSRHSRIRDRFRVGTFVGASIHKSRFEIGELLDVKNQKATLDELRRGQKNIIVTTSALEEGIDISSCNHVVCFQKPPNLKSFIQRRGRARNSESMFTIMFNEHSDLEALSTWQHLEEQMIEIYMDETRLLKEIQKLEVNEEAGDRYFQVDSTGAKLTQNDALRHLYHFCATLPRAPYVDCRPIFTFSNTGNAVTAKAILPSSVDASVREACSNSQWKTERCARNDAAFEAYIALYHAGLVNDHLLPLRFDPEADEAKLAVEKRPNIVDVPAQLNIWSDLVASEWQGQPMLYESSVLVQSKGVPISRMLMILPLAFQGTANFELFWDGTITFDVEISPGRPSRYTQEHLGSCASCTALVLRSIYKHRMVSDRIDFACLFVPAIAEDLQTWMATVRGSRPATSLLDKDINPSHVGLIRDLANNERPHIFHGIDFLRNKLQEEDALSGKQVMPGQWPEECVGDGVFLNVTKLSKRSDLLHQIPLRDMVNREALMSQMLPADRCKVDNLPFEFSQFANLIPSIMHQVEVHIAAESCGSSLLSSVQINDLTLIVTATAASVAREQTDYQRLEFLGDSMLKYFTTLTLMSEHLTWHEGILSARKDHIVSNSSLASAALQVGLAKFIRTIPFTGQKWRPLYNSNLIADQVKETREMSTKTLADVIEALIGASYIDGGPEKVLRCLAVFLPKIPWGPSSVQIEKLHMAYNVHIQYPPHFSQLEDLIKYKFTTKALLVEALTHPSRHGSDTCSSYQRLEFLGDSILDNIIVTNAYNYEPSIPTPSLHLLRTALVNASFLAFLCLNLTIPITRYDAIVEGKGFSTIETAANVQIWRFMRYVEPTIREAQLSCVARYVSLRSEILHALKYGHRYPWTIFTQLDAPKFFSDIIESIVGAIYIDSHGSFEACQSFLERLGVMEYLQRAMDGKIALLHPKEELGRLADMEKVKYVTIKETEGGDEEDRKILTCAVWVGERNIAKIKGGINGMDVETRAADEAIGILKAEKIQKGEASRPGTHELAKVQDQPNESSTGRADEVEDVFYARDDVKTDDYRTNDERGNGNKKAR